MIFAAVGDTGYDVMLVVHILFVIVGLAPMFVHPFLARQLTAADNPAVVGLLDRMTRNGRVIYTPALVIGGFMGFGVAGMSDDVFKVSQPWLMTAVWVWIAMLGVYHGLMIPAEKALARGEKAAMRRLDLGGALVSILLVIQLYLMVFKPGQ
jgi:uncharacterized membrane protein